MERRAGRRAVHRAARKLDRRRGSRMGAPRTPRPLIHDQPARQAFPANAFPTKAVETRIDTLRWRSNPGSTPSRGGQTPDRPPLDTLRVAVKPRIDTLTWRSNPGSTPSRGGQTPARHPQGGGQTPDRHPQVAVKTRIDHHASPSSVPVCRVSVTRG